MMAERKPNFLFFLPDQHRPDFVGTNPDLPVRMPNLTELGRRGVRFTNCYTPSPVCAPARACLASGRHYDRCQVPDNSVDYPLEQPTYYQSLRDAGYRVAGCGKFDLHKATNDWGLDGKRLIEEWGFTDGIDNEGKYDGVISYGNAGGPMGPYMAYLEERGLAQAHGEDLNSRDASSTFPTPLPEEAYCDNWVAENGLALLRDIPEGHPWHLVVNFTGPHNPWDVTEGMKQRWEEVEFPPAHHNDQFGGDVHCRVRQNYAAMVENIDRHIGRFLDELETRGELDNTVIIYSSDHGEMLGDHNNWGKGTWRESSSHVPLTVCAPGSLEGAVSDALVPLHDLCATMIDYAGAEALPQMDARSVRPVLEGQWGEHRKYLTSGLRDWRMVFDGRHKLVRDQQSIRLFDLQEDPHEDVDIAADRPGLVEDLSVMLPGDE
jgi:arylsulfatase A-like enzyme